MLVLIGFALIAGAGTGVTPCVLPVLPALLSASAVGGRRRPFGIITGLAVTFAISIVALASITRGVGLGSGTMRVLAWIVLVAFGLILLIPQAAQRVQTPLSRLARFGPKTRGDGFVSGIGVGAALGFVCAPCAGPILAAVVSVSASGNTSARVVAVAIAYTIGLCAVLTLYAIGGRKLSDIVRRRARGHLVERGLGTILVITGVLIAFNLDVSFENTLARATSGADHSGLLAFIVDPTGGLENSKAVQQRLNSLRPANRFVVAQQRSDAHVTGSATPELGRLGRAPEFTGTEDWFNTPHGAALSLRGLRGKVVLVDFWTYTCINCLRTLPFLERLYDTYRRDGLVVVGVETPEFTFEQNAANVGQAIRADGLTYPVVQDNRYGTWNAYQNQYWPGDYLIDATGEVRHTQFGEGGYAVLEASIRALLRRAGARRLPNPVSVDAMSASAGLATPETYLNPVQARGFVTPLRRGTHTYPGAAVKLNQVALQGPWHVRAQSLTPAGPGAQIQLGFKAAHVYLVLTATDGRPHVGQIRLDGHLIPPADAGRDVHASVVTVSAQRLYSLVSLRSVQRHTLTVELPPGVGAYDFTFG